MKPRLFFHKLFHWEFWPYTVVYIPVYFLWAFYALKARTIFFFNAANPGIRNGGFINESKKDIYDLIPQRYYPKTYFVKEGTPVAAVLEKADEAGIHFPFIAKPDMGLRGSAVKKINSETEWIEYAEKARFDYLIQELIPYQNEIGIFYVRHPDQARGHITGIVKKEFMVLTGDGASSLRQLVKREPRFELQLKTLEKEYGSLLETIPEGGVAVNLMPYGNHCRGSKFLDAKHLITPNLEAVINEMCLQIPGFYFGRMDLRYDTIEALEKGRNFLLVELNGAGSEPTHMYDPSHSIFFGWKELLRHLRMMYQISAANHQNGAPYLNHKQGMAAFKAHNKRLAVLAEF